MVRSREPPPPPRPPLATKDLAAQNFDLDQSDAAAVQSIASAVVELNSAYADLLRSTTTGEAHGSTTRTDASARVAGATIAVVAAALRVTASRDTEYPARVAETLDVIADVVDSLGHAGSPAQVLLTTLDAVPRLAVAAQLGETFHIPSDVVRFMNLGVVLASARTPDAASHAIEAFAAPASSFQHKYEHQFAFALNGYVGFGGGVEGALGDWSGGGYGNAWAGSAALLAPVGLDVTLTKPGDTSFGLFVSALDVGALLPIGGVTQLAMAPAAPMAPMMTDMTGHTRLVDPVQFVGPGLFARLELAHTPFAVLLGAELMPRGRVFTDLTGRDTVVPVFRGFVAIAVDVTIFPFD